MFIVVILLWIIAILLIYANPKKPWAWWVSCCLFFNGFGGVAVVFNDTIIPYANSSSNSKLVCCCLIGKGIADVLHHYFATYAFIASVLVLTNFLELRIKNTTKLIILVSLSIPCILMCILYPIAPDFNPNYIVLSAWVVFYTLAANIILLISIFREKDSSKKYQKILVSILAVPTTFLIMWTSYLSVALGYHEVWYLNIWIVLTMFIIFVILALKYGVLGVRLRVERSNLEDTIDTLINGVSIISHAVKNEASTISLCVDTIKSIDGVSPNTEKKLDVIKESCKNLSEFTQKINKFRIYEMDFKPYVLNVLIDKVISQVLPLASERGIKINNYSKEDITIMVDAMHVTEVFKNLLINAIEAIEAVKTNGADGIINIKTELIERIVYVSVEDNGVGIQQEYIEKVVTPFYSTKKGKNNYGLGLSYCYKVMKCHKGSLKINSKINQGTTMSLLFPRERVLSVSNTLQN